MMELPCPQKSSISAKYDQNGGMLIRGHGDLGQIASLYSGFVDGVAVDWGELGARDSDGDWERLAGVLTYPIGEEFAGVVSHGVRV